MFAFFPFFMKTVLLWTIGMIEFFAVIVLYYWLIFFYPQASLLFGIRLGIRRIDWQQLEAFIIIFSVYFVFSVLMILDPRSEGSIIYLPSILLFIPLSVCLDRVFSQTALRNCLSFCRKLGYDQTLKVMQLDFSGAFFVCLFVCFFFFVVFFRFFKIFEISTVNA